MDERAAFWELLAAMTRGGALCLCVLWCFVVGIGGGVWGCFFNMMVWELALRLADLFLLHLEILCFCCAFLRALHYLRVRLVNFFFVYSDVLTPYAYAPPWTPLNPGFYSISGGCRNS